MTINRVNRQVMRFSIFWSVAVGLVLSAMVAGQLLYFGRIFPWYTQTREMAEQLAAEQKRAAETAEKIDDNVYSGNDQRTVVPLNAELKAAELLQITILEMADDSLILNIYEDEARSKNSRFTVSLFPEDKPLVLKMLPEELLTVRGSSWKIKVEPVVGIKPQTVFENLPVYAEWQSTGTGSFYYDRSGEYIKVRFADGAGETVSWCNISHCFTSPVTEHGVSIYMPGNTAENSDDIAGTVLGIAGTVLGNVITVRAKPGQSWHAFVQDSDYDEHDAATQQEMQRQRENYKGDSNG